MAFTFDKQGPVIIMKCAGPLDLNNAQTLKDALLVGIENSDNLVVNCERVDEIDSQCIQIFCTAHRMAVQRLRFICGPPSSVQLLLQSTQKHQRQTRRQLVGAGPAPRR